MVDHFDFKFDLIFLDCGIPTDIVQILKIYLGKKFARIKWNDHKGDYKVLNKGVRKDLIRTPFLTNLLLSVSGFQISSND